MTGFPLHCARLDKHEPHDWTGKRGFYSTAGSHHCTGHVVIEGGWRAMDDADDAAEERAIQDRREIA